MDPGLRKKICISVPVRNVGDYKKLEYIRRFHDGYVEFRLDYSSEPVLPAISDDKVIITVRDPKEGGQYDISPEKKLELYRKAEDMGLTVDAEYAFVKEHPLDISDIILSKHLKHTPTVEIVEREVDEMLSQGPKWVKYITTAGSYEVAMSTLGILGRKNIIHFSMGRYGSFTRLLAPLLGSPLVYVSLEESTAPGQLSYGELINVWRVMDAEL